MKKSVQEWFHDLLQLLRDPQTRTNYRFGEINRIVRKIHVLEPKKLPRSVRLAMGQELLNVLRDNYEVWPIEVTMLAVNLIDRQWNLRDHANPKQTTSPAYKELQKHGPRVIDGSHFRLLIYNKFRMQQHAPAHRYALREATRILEAEAKRQYNPVEDFPMSTGDQYGF